MYKSQKLDIERAKANLSKAYSFYTVIFETAEFQTKIKMLRLLRAMALGFVCFPFWIDLLFSARQVI